MNLLDPHRFDQLPESEVLRRIGELLATVLHHARPRLSAPPPAKEDISDLTELIADPTERLITKHLHRCGQTSVRRLARELELPSHSVFPALSRLRAKGLCVQVGRTSGARYRLKEDFGAN